MYRAFLRMEARTEHHLLHQAIALHGASNGAAVSSLVGTRTNRQCLQRWRRTTPSTVRGPWAPEDDAALLAAAAACGIGAGTSTSDPPRANWSNVAKLVVGRTDNQCRDRYLWLAERRATHSSLAVTETWDPGMDRGLVDLVRDHGPRWALIGGILGKPDTLVAAQYARIVREMAAGERPDLSDVSLLEAVRLVERDSLSLTNMKAVVTRVVNAVNPEIPMFPTLASIHALSTASKAIVQLKHCNAARSQLKAVDQPPVPQPVLQALYRTFAMTSMTGTCDPRPVGWTGLDSEREKQAQIFACRAIIQNANRPRVDAAARAHSQADDADQHMDQERSDGV
ncbi:hypothetical protein BCR44DRAFT_1241134 [Catenaria anguillulae PL171]|uniref:Myb-like domain-containing protein n=1 Tax=Catenaria anguillulae PL171 TaxID=765915 RepID=A0A1Y2HF29_9FUNG|nr:hypothetical protein BCR44DRAFT_1241134 [Catenaria anguillulae PL171]